MSKEAQRKTKMREPWGTLHTVLWLLGIAVLAWQSWWWPGILVLIGLSLLYQTVLRRVNPDAFRSEFEPAREEPENPSAPVAAVETAAPTTPQYPLDLLPITCPKCGGPIRSHEVSWSSPRSADCPFCGANLPLSKPG